MPLYLVKQTLNGKEKAHVDERMVEAPNKARAIGHVAKDTIAAELCEPKDVVRLTKEGKNIEEVEE